MLYSRRQPIGVVLTCVMAIGISSAKRGGSASLSVREWPKLLQQARHGDPKAQTRVAMAYKKGKPVRQDSEEAVKWFSEAAKQADPIAESNLGLMFYQGQ